MDEMLEKLKGDIAQIICGGCDVDKLQTCKPLGLCPEVTLQVDQILTRMKAEGYRKVPSEKEIEQQFWQCQNPNGTLSVSRLHQFLMEQE